MPFSFCLYAECRVSFIVTLSVDILNVVVLSVGMLSVEVPDDPYNGTQHNMKIHDTQHDTTCLSVVCAVLVFLNCYAECHYAGCRCTECRGASLICKTADSSQHYFQHFYKLVKRFNPAPLVMIQFAKLLVEPHIVLGEVSPLPLLALSWGARYLTGENLKVVWAEFPTLS